MGQPDLTIHVTDTGLKGMAMGMKLAEIRAAIPELDAACNRKIEASEDFANLCKLTGLKAGVEASVVSSFITARCNDTQKKSEKKAEQLSILFDKIA